MAIELDHLFICSNVNAPEIDRILQLGFTEGRANTHPGQGTANRCIFFENAMLEFLWVTNEAEASSAIVAPTSLRERWRYRETGYSPFGIGCRKSETTANLPFNTWAYCPKYLPPQIKIDIAKDTKPNEPLLFVIPFAEDTHNKPVHANGIQEITKVEITIPNTESLSPAIKSIQQHNLVKFIKGKKHLLSIEFDRAIQQKSRDFRPHLPLRFFW